MAFKEVKDLQADTTIALGGFNKKAKKDNPTSIEGYYLGHKLVDDHKNPGKKVKIHTFKTPQGNVAVWGKTDLDRKLASIPENLMTRASFKGEKTVPRGTMYEYKVESNEDDVLESASGETVSVDEYEDEDLGEDEAALDEVTPVRPSAPKSPLVATASQKARAEAILSKQRKTA